MGKTWKRTAISLMTVTLLAGNAMTATVFAEESVTESQALVNDANDIQNYLWELSTDMDDESFELYRTRNYKIINELKPLFTEESFNALYKANVHMRQKQEGAKEEFIEAQANLEQLMSVSEGVTFLWDSTEQMPVDGDKVYSEEELDAGQLDGYGFVPYMINYLLDDPTQAKGNILLFSGGNRTNDGESFQTAELFRELGYNAFVVNARMNPYSQRDALLDTQRAIRMVKYLAQENSWGGSDMIAICGFSAGGLKVINLLESGYVAETPNEIGAAAYTPDEIDEQTCDINVAIMVYTGNDDPLKETGTWPALLLVAGSEDGTGATQRLENYYENCKDIVPTTLLMYEGAGHGFGPGTDISGASTPATASWTNKADEFMQANLGYNQATSEGEVVSVREDIPADGEDSATEEASQDEVEAGSENTDAFELKVESGEVEVIYYDGAEVEISEADGVTTVNVPEGMQFSELNIYCEEGDLTIQGVLADQYILETVHGDLNIYLPEDTAFHAQLTTISDLFECDFDYDVTGKRHEYFYGEGGVDLQLTTLSGTARIMKSEN